MPRASFAANRAGWGKPKPPAFSMLSFPAPQKGINALAPMASMDPDSCNYMVNMRPDGQGLRVRTGYAQYVTGVGSDVRTVIPFQSLNTANDKLFGVTSTGIYDFTTGGSGPWSPALTFSSTGGNAGWGVYTNFVSDAGTHYGFYADEDNGLFRRAEGGSWAAVTDITGVNETSLVFVMEYKSSLWFVQRGTADAWYLAAGNISGAATVFHFGNKFQHGGTLVGLWNWTVDGGNGTDDFLVAMSSQGDVIVYKFTDPSDITTFQQTSQYYIGALPAGRRLATQNGGELLLLCQLGIVPMTALMSGRPVSQTAILASGNITPLVSQAMLDLRNERGWELKIVPSENAMFMATPKIMGYPYKQFVMSTDTNGWGVYNDLEYFHGETYAGIFYMGGEDGLNTLTGTEDNVDIDTLAGVPITFSVITAFVDAGDPGMFHQTQFIRPVFRTGGALSYDTEARYDYNTDDFVPSLAAIVSTGAVWDVGIWDTAIWGTNVTTVGQPGAASGIGRAVGVVLTGQTSSSTILIRIDCVLTKGGPL